jgi:hypothetical protein
LGFKPSRSNNVLDCAPVCPPRFCFGHRAVATGCRKSYPKVLHL